MPGPIKPSEVAERKAAAIPDEVFDVFNELIVEAMEDGEAIVDQEQVAKAAAKRLGVSVAHVYDKKWLDIEDAYRKAGWTVVYDKPGYNEDYAATFTFRRGRKRS